MSPRRARAVAGRVDVDPATALREHLVDTAEKLLTERQISAITTRDIALSAGVSDGVLYNYFGDKNELLLAALIRRYQGVVSRFDDQLPEPGTATVEDNLNTFGRALLEMQADVLPMMTGLISEPALLRRFVDGMHGQPHGPQHTMQRLIDYLRAEQRLGRLPETIDPDAVNTLLMGATALLAFTGLLSPAGTGQPVADGLPSVVNTLIRGLVP
jgi:AcrR family transcriptional regulator